MADEETPEVIEETPVEETPVAEAEAWAPSREEFERLTQFQQAAVPILSQLQEIMSDPQVAQEWAGVPQQQQQADPEWDPFEPESVQAYFNHQIEQRLGEALGPFEGLLGMVAQEKGEALARQELESIQSAVGEFDKDTAFLVAGGLIERGTNPREALASAAQYMHTFEARVREDERQKYMAEMGALGGSPSEVPSGSGPATEIEKVPTGPGRYDVAVARVLERRQAARRFPVG
jgi:hypothetical protein